MARLHLQVGDLYYDSGDKEVGMYAVRTLRISTAPTCICVLQVPLCSIVYAVITRFCTQLAPAPSARATQASLLLPTLVPQLRTTKGHCLDSYNCCPMTARVILTSDGHPRQPV